MLRMLVVVGGECRLVVSSPPRGTGVVLGGQRREGTEKPRVWGLGDSLGPSVPDLRVLKMAYEMYWAPNPGTSVGSLEVRGVAQLTASPG